MLAVIGDQFADCEVEPSGQDADGENNGGGNEWPQICGCTISVRQNEDIITVWNRVENDAKVKEKIKYVCFTVLRLTLTNSCSQTIRRALNLPSTTTMEYKSNNGTPIPGFTDYGG